MRKRQWIIGSLVPLTLIGICLVVIAATYQPLLFVVGDVPMRQDDWEKLCTMYYQGGERTLERDRLFLEQRSMEELVLLKAKQLGVTIDETRIREQLNQLGKTPQERQAKLTELHMTEEDSMTNIRRAMYGMQVKQRITKDVTVTKNEVEAFYRQNEKDFLVPELRTVRFFRTARENQAVVQEIKLTPVAQFAAVVNKYNDGTQHFASYEEYIDRGSISKTLGERMATAVFQAPKHTIIGPVVDGPFAYLFLIEHIEAPRKQTFAEVQNKLYQTILIEKQTAYYRQWLQQEQKTNRYELRLDNLQRDKLTAFFYDLPSNVQLLLGM